MYLIINLTPENVILIVSYRIWEYVRGIKNLRFQDEIIFRNRLFKSLKKIFLGFSAVAKNYRSGKYPVIVKISHFI